MRQALIEAVREGLPESKVIDRLLAAGACSVTEVKYYMHVNGVEYGKPIINKAPEISSYRKSELQNLSVTDL